MHHGAAVAQGSTQAESCGPGPPEVAHYCRSLNPRTGAQVAGSSPGGTKRELLYRRVLAQKPQDTNKIYSLHEPHIYCVAKGKEDKKYEFGTKASVAMTKTHGVIVAACLLPHRQRMR